ncbi:MAG: restriction endonuclease subunit S [Desulfobacterales bacterium]|nr:restriction endonuclease subunit S [Desulfobacterales bacterium]
MSEWKEYKLGDVIFLIGGGTPKTSNTEYWNGTIPWLSVTDFNNGKKYCYTSDKSITEKGLKESSTKILKKGQIIISARGTVGVVSMLGNDMAFNQSNYGIDANSKYTCNDFLYYWLKNSLSTFLSNSYGAVFDTITKSTFDNLIIELPPLPEQQAIASVLSSLDDKIDLLHRQNKTLEDMAETLFRQWFVEEAEEGWEEKRLENLCTITRGSSPRPIIEYVVNGTVPWIKIADGSRSNNFFIDKTNEFITEAGVSKSVKVFHGDLILSNSATCGFPYFVELEGCIHDGWLLFRDFKGISKFFLFFFLKQIFKELNSIADGSVQNNLNTGILKEYLVKLPPTSLLTDFDKQVYIIVNRIKINILQIRTLEKLRDTLLPKLMSGEVRVIV